MKKNKKNLSKLEKYNLKFMVEDFLGKDRDKLEKELNESPEKANVLWDKLEEILSQGFQHPGEPDIYDKQGTDYIKLTIELHKLLKPVFLSLQQVLLDFKFKILPGRISSRKLISDIESGKIDKKEQWYEYRKLVNQDSPIEQEQFFDITFDTTIMQHISFESGNITFHNNPTQQILNFLDLFRNVPISYFSRCAFSECGKVIILTRSNKKHCKICAARKGQYVKRRDYPEATRAKDKERYHTKRKK